MKQVRPYSALAQVYDLVMAHVDYEGWADYLVHLVEMHFEDADQLEVLELGAGSGLAQRGPLAPLHARNVE